MSNIENIENETDQEAAPTDCLFTDEGLLPKSITICMRDSFIKRDVDHQSRVLQNALKNTEEAILKSQEQFADLGNYELKVEKPDEQLVYDLTVPKVNLNDENKNSANDKNLISDIKERSYEMMDIDPDSFLQKMKEHEAAGKIVDKDSQGNYKVPKFELNLVLTIKRKHLIMNETKMQDKLDANALADEVNCDFDQQMPQFSIFKGIRVQWDKSSGKIISECYEPESKIQTDTKHIKENLTMHAASNMHRIPNEQVIDFRDKLVRDNFLKVETKQFEQFNDMKCDVMQKYDELMENFKKELNKYELEITQKDVDQLSNLDGSYAVNWFDIKLEVKNTALAEPVPQESDLCKDQSKDGVNSINYKDNFQCGGVDNEA